MSIQPEEFLSQSPSAFLEQPGFLETAALAPPPPKVEDDPNFMKVAVGIAAALVVLRVLMKAALSKETPQTPEEVNAAAGRIYRRIFPAWMQAAVPAIAQAYRLGSTENITYAELEKMASAYAAELGDYVHQSSILALTEGFNAQVNAGWSERLAWARVTEGYGLDSSQMRSYVKGLMSRDKEDYLSEPIPAGARAAVDRAFLTRADRVGTNEAFKASQVGRNVVWLSLQASGQLPEGTMKRWITADDERVCVVCGPLHMVTIPLHRRFESNGQYFYAPGVHPNCRCEIELVYPELGINVVKALGDDPFDRDRRGRFAESESRQARKMDLLNERNMDLLNERDLSALNEGTKQRKKVSDKALASLNTAQALDILNDTSEAEFEALKAKVSDAKAEQQLAALAEQSKTKKQEAEKAKLLEAAKHKQAQRRKVRDLKPSDPQRWDTTVWVPADLYLRKRGINTADIGKGSIIDFTYEDKTARQIGLRVREETGGIGNGLGTGFDAAFKDYMGQEGDHLIAANRAVMEEQEKAGEAVSDPKVLIPGEEGPAKEWATVLSARDKGTLLSWWQILADNQEAYMYLGDVPQEGEMTATEMAEVLLMAAKAEADDNFKVGNNRVIGQYLDDKVEWNNDNNTRALREDELVHDRHQMMADDSSVYNRVEPVLFRVRGGWYGTRSSNASGTTKDAIAQGRYRVTDVSKIPVPEGTREEYGEDEMAKTIKNLVIVDLELEDGVR